MNAIFDSPQKRVVWDRAYGASMVLGTIALSAAVTLVAWGATLWLPGFVPAWGGHFGVPVALALAQVPTFFVTRYYLFARRRRSFVVAFWVQSAVQFVWLQWTCWESTPHLWIVGLMMATSWMFHDTWFLPGRATRWLYAAMFPAFDLALLAADTFGGHGLLATLAQHHDWVVAMLACQVLVAVLMQAYMVNLEVEALAHDKALIHERALEHELTLARREREIVQGSAMLLATGVNASKFSHDVTWPATVVDMTARVINEMLDDAPADAPREWVRVLRAAMVDVTNSAQCVMQMTSALATSLRTGEVVGPVAVTQLGDEVAQFFRRAMRGHGIVPVKPRVRLETVDVWVTPGHASSLGNLLVNGGLQAPGEALEMTGAPLDEWFYLLRVRDFGVADQERETALRTVQATLDSLESSSRISIPDDNGASYRGFGVGLLLAKIHLLRHNGAIAVTTPVEGPGLEFLIALPRVDPATIPESENQPERLLRELPRRQVSVPTIAQAS